MIDQTIIDNAVTILQLAYTAAGSSCVVQALFPTPWADLTAPILIVVPGRQIDALIMGSSTRGTPGPPTYQYTPDFLRLIYRAPSVTQQTPDETFDQAQRARIADLNVLTTIFKRPPIAALADHDPFSLDGACLEAGKTIIPDPQDEPYEQGDTQGTVRLTWKVNVSIRVHNH